MLYLVATPIGNMEDITFRAIRVLNEVSTIFAEDTRHSLKLLNFYDIKKPLVSCHEHNELDRIPQILALLQDGQDIALISDAGMPGISDPGYRVVRAAIDANFEITVIPGASAALTALVTSGLPCDSFAFEGFLPRDKSKLRTKLLQLKNEQRTAIIYESPLRLQKTLNALCDALGSRPAAVCRELTKLHETCIRATLPELCEHFALPVKGECVIVLGGASNLEDDMPSLDELLTQMRDLIESGHRAKDAAKLVSNSEYGKNQLYDAYIKSQSFE